MDQDYHSVTSGTTSSYSRTGTGSTLDDRPRRRLGLAYSLLNFPDPHQLGQSTGAIKRSKSLRVSAVGGGGGGGGHSSREPPLMSPASAGTSVNILSILSQEAGIDEPDYTPPTKKPRLSHKAVVTTHDNMPLKEFSLFLPSKLPAAIPNSTSVLRDFVFKCTATYLRLWDLSPEMDCVEVRLPSLYEDMFCENAKFLKDFIGVVFRELPDVKSIRDLYLPKVMVGIATNLEDILSGIDAAAISHLYLPLSSNLSVDEIMTYDFESFLTFLHSLEVEQVTIVSVDQVIGEFTARLAEEVGLLQGCNIQVTYMNEDLEAPGPHYIACLGDEGTGGELIEPNELLRSMNVYNVPKHRKDKNVIKSKGQKASKPKAKGAFSSDCTYFDEAELTANSPFPSTIWNLDRLHNNGIDGTGTTIAIVDSGINYTHPTFKNKIIAVKNFVKNKIDNIDCVIDSDGHGTHCAGLAAAAEFYCPTSTSPDSECILLPPGVAPGAKLVICKVVKTTDGDVDSDAFIAALQWLQDLHMSGKTKIDVVSISLAATYYSHRQAQIISEMTGLGIIVVCCASNVGRLHLQPIAFPARLGQVLCIGAHDENGKPTSFSPVGRELDFLSPGDNLWGPGPGTKGPFAMDCASGTSCATPAVAGLICLILHAVTKICKKDPRKYEIGGKPLIDLIHNVWVMRELLKVISSSPGHHSDEIGYGTLNPYRLLDRSDEEILRIVNDIVEDE